MNRSTKWSSKQERINVGGSVIEGDYTGEVKVILMNHGTQDCLIQEGERIAPIIVEKSKPKQQSK